jgi:hypothetical protein
MLSKYSWPDCCLLQWMAMTAQKSLANADEADAPAARHSISGQQAIGLVGDEKRSGHWDDEDED